MNPFFRNGLSDQSRKRGVNVRVNVKCHILFKFQYLYCHMFLGAYKEWWVGTPRVNLGSELVGEDLGSPNACESFADFTYQSNADALPFTS